VSTTIGVDVGGTKVSVAVLRDGRLSDPVLRPTATGSPDELVDQLTQAIKDAGEAQAVGLGIPSVVDFEQGMALSSVNVPLQDVPLRTILGDRLGIPVFVDNDATVAALAEAHDDDGTLIAHSLVMLTVGTGVGGGIVIDGQVYRGATGAAGEVGHQLIGAHVEDGTPEHVEHFPQPGSLERLGAGRALDLLAQERGLRDGPHAVEAAQAGDERGREAIRILGERLGVGIANMINTFDPQLVVIGGGVSAAGEMLLAPARETAVRFVLPGVGRSTEIRLARYGPRAGVRGAALLAAGELRRAAAHPIPATPNAA
jgi:glucokinase